MRKQMRAELLELMMDKRIPDPPLRPVQKSNTAVKPHHIPKTKATSLIKSKLSEKEEKERLDGNNSGHRHYLGIFYASCIFVKINLIFETFLSIIRISRKRL